MAESRATQNRAAIDSLSLSQSGSGIELLNELLVKERQAEPGSGQLSRLTIQAGKRLILAGQPFHELMLVNQGYLKTVFSDEAGNEQVVGFPVRGDLLGTDGISNNSYFNDVVSLTDVEVLLIPFTQLSSLQQIHPSMVDSLFRIISHQLVQEQLALTAIGALSAESRVVRFLLKLSLQMRIQGQPESVLHLHMTRQDIGNYLGMKIETVSRTLSLLASQGLVSVNQRDIELRDKARLESIARLESVARDGVVRSSFGPVRKTGRASIQHQQVHSRDNPPTPWSGLVDL